MEHPIPEKAGEIAGFDLERKVMIVFVGHRHLGMEITEIQPLTDDQIRRLRAHWRHIVETPDGKGNRT